MTRGRYIAFEGGEGSGKTTQAARLATALGALLTGEPGGTKVGGLIRAIVLDPANGALADRAEALLYAADRAQHAAEVVRPALAAGRDVVSDRSAWSSVVYQGHGRGMDVDAVRRLSDWATLGCWPDLIVLLDVDAPTAAARMARALDRLERVGEGFHERVRSGFRALAAADPERWVVVDGRPDADAVATAVVTAVSERMGA
jgi:dTMP kinase